VQPTGSPVEKDGRVVLAWERWMTVISMYSQCALTRQSDKLIAISGLAVEFEKHFGPTAAYVVGMWQPWLVYLLLWRVADGKKGDGTPCSTQEMRQSPSWSWVSVDGAVIGGAEFRLAGMCQHSKEDRHKQLVRMLVSICEVRIDLARPELPYGQVNDAALELRGRLFYADYLFWSSWYGRQDLRHASLQYAYATIDMENQISFSLQCTFDDPVEVNSIAEFSSKEYACSLPAAAKTDIHASQDFSISLSFSTQLQHRQTTTCGG
jgi:hypothetical protein